MSTRFLPPALLNTASPESSINQSDLYCDNTLIDHPDSHKTLELCCGQITLGLVFLSSVCFCLFKIVRKQFYGKIIMRCQRKCFEKWSTFSGSVVILSRSLAAVCVTIMCHNEELSWKMSWLNTNRLSVAR